VRRELAIVVVVVVVAGGCAPSSSPSLVFRTPQALVACAQPPEQLQARLWISGSSDPCLLAVDVAASTTSGECETAPGIVRRFTLDWFVDVAGREVVLAQAQQDVDLAGEQASIDLVFADDDVKVAGCLDMSVDSFSGSEVVDVDGADRPVCDLDEDGTDNLSEVCSGDDPIGGT
jgi:hypothetical protein